MKVDTVAEKLLAKILTPSKVCEKEIRRFCAFERISELLNGVTSDTLLVSGKLNPQLLRVAELFEVPAICILGDTFPDPEMIKAAIENETMLMVSSLGKKEVCERLTRCLDEEVTEP